MENLSHRNVIDPSGSLGNVTFLMNSGARFRIQKFYRKLKNEISYIVSIRNVYI